MSFLNLVTLTYTLGHQTNPKYWQLEDESLYNAGQKKRNSELRIFRGPPNEGAQLWTQSNILKHHYSTPSSLVNHLQSWSTSSRELTKNSWIRVAFLLTNIVCQILCLSGSEMHIHDLFWKERAGCNHGCEDLCKVHTYPAFLLFVIKIRFWKDSHEFLCEILQILIDKPFLWAK